MKSRLGLHAPLAHQALETLPDGTVRYSLGYFNTLDDFQLAIKAVRKIAAKMESFEDA
jgi:hypothetical protein